MMARKSLQARRIFKPVPRTKLRARLASVRKAA